MFSNDYLSGCHPIVLDAIVQSNMEQTAGYGKDDYCERARLKIKEKLQKKDADIHFLVGGTQTNKIVIETFLRPYQGVIAVETGHIATHETGAIEATGHKVLTIPEINGKLTAKQLEAYYEAECHNHMHEHMVSPGMVYISHPTELGTVYTREELKAIYEVCQKAGWPLFVDGARLGYVLNERISDITLADLAKYTDAFYIGGTKCGAMMGEAAVIMNPHYQKDFRSMIKRGGGLLAKGRLLGIQFDCLFSDHLYEDICYEAVRYALQIKKAFEEKGIQFLVDSTTNQQFPIVPDELAKELQLAFGFSLWEKVDEKNTALRYCTSWATTPNEVLELIGFIHSL
ncbi:L-threonine aldolase [Granulicatella balaenopterae]|uniref:L-threonine aldolase n=1 Tax=Granulicatella balaenopterae TaxID=137733 RepID=A0A1H9KMT6_9LACT|nr:aminotransferase class I/II-fold pyridoxal phosphate-dependent enzyme [Granulicatella balaenopterae]SER00163.1 L-threonine aldolase [Granulicatella balaenopterae]